MLRMSRHCFARRRSAILRLGLFAAFCAVRPSAGFAVEGEQEAAADSKWISIDGFETQASLAGWDRWIFNGDESHALAKIESEGGLGYLSLNMAGGNAK